MQCAAPQWVIVVCLFSSVTNSRRSRLKYQLVSNDYIIILLLYFQIFFHLSRDRVFPEDRARFYGAEIVSALDYLHKQSVIYRDLKVW